VWAKRHDATVRQIQGLQRGNGGGVPDHRNTSATRLCVFAHYDPEGVLDEYVVRLLAGLREVCSKLVFAIRKRLESRTPSQLLGFKGLLPLFRNKYGLEVGGPSGVFKAEGLMPLYQSASSIDGCNFSNSTTWEGQIQEGMSYHVARETGYQFIAEAADLKMICSNKYDFLLASHCLEHVANPLGALSEWIRVLEDGGILLLILPDKNATFDHQRPVTKFSHPLDDFERRTP